MNIRAVIGTVRTHMYGMLKSYGAQNMGKQKHKRCKKDARASKTPKQVYMSLCFF